MVKILEEVDMRLAFMSWTLYWTPTATACEVLARRIVHLTEPDKVKSIMSMRYKHRQIDGDESELSNALELAIDQHWYFHTSIHLLWWQKIDFSSTIFISSNESQEGKDFFRPLSCGNKWHLLHKSCQCALEWWCHSEKQWEWWNRVWAIFLPVVRLCSNTLYQMFNTLKLVKTHFGDISIHLDCLCLGTLGPVKTQSPS